MIDATGDDPGAEVVFVAVPAAGVAGVVRRLLADEGRRPDAVVTDVSGVKTAIVAEADHPRFIGGHPMAGSEQIGLHGADPDLFEGAVWVLTPTAGHRPGGLRPAAGCRAEPGGRRPRALGRRTTTGSWPSCPMCPTSWPPRS